MRLVLRPLFRLALLGTMTVVSGCVSQRSMTSFVSHPSSVGSVSGNFQMTENTELNSAKSIAVQQVALASANSNLEDADNVVPSVRVAVKYSPNAVELPPDQGNMSLSDFESLALCNNPTIAELVATTQKAASFRTQVSLRANLQVGAPMPVFNKNQGNIAAARAELVRASREVERIENSIKARLAAVSRDYDSSRAAVTKYSGDILPNADESLKLAEAAYRAGATSFVQVLVARRTYFDTNLQYIASQSQLAQARAKVNGYVLTGALDAVQDNSGDDSLRGLTFSQQ